MIACIFGRREAGWLATILCKTRELRCFLLGFAPSATRSAEAAFSAAEALRKAVRA